MPTSDTLTAHASIANNASQTIQPGSGIEWWVNNLYPGGAYQVYKTNGTNTILLSTGTDAEILPVRIRCSNTIYLSVKNVSGSTKYFGYDGIIYK